MGNTIGQNIALDDMDSAQGKRQETQVSTVQSDLQLNVVDHLPNEILGEIMLQYVQDVRREYEGAPWNDYMQKPYSWLAITHICRHWREVALHHPRLWDWIVPMRPASTTAFIERSGERPLTVLQRRLPNRNPLHLFDFGIAFTPPETPAVQDMGASLELLYQQFHRIEHLDVHCNYRAPLALVPGAPMLRSLTLRVPQAPETPMLDFMNAFPVNALPSLTTFRTWCDPTTTQRIIHPHLTSLTLSGQTIPNGSKNLLLDILQSTLALRHLHFYRAECLFGIDENAATLPNPGRTVDLPLLRTIYIADKGCGRAAAFMLRHLTVPITISAEIVGYSGSSQYLVTNALLQVVQNTDVDDSPLALAVCAPNDRDIALKIWSSGAQLTGYLRFTEWGRPRITYSLSGVVASAVGFDFHTIVHRVTTLYIDIPLTYTEWVDVFGGMANLRQLQIVRMAMPLPNRTPSLRIPGLDDGIFSGLHTVVLDGVCWSVGEDPARRTDPSQLATDLVVAVHQRDAVNKIVIRNGRGLLEADIFAISLGLPEVEVDWDGVMDD